MNPNQFTLSQRPELSRFSPYRPGLSMQEIQRRFKLKSVIKLASNENPLGPSPKALAAYKKASSRLSIYPESRSTDLRVALAKKFKVSPEEIIIGAGSDEIIELLAKSFLTPFNDIIVSESAFLQYSLAGALMGARVIAVPLKDMKHDLMGMAARVTDKTKLLFIANPNNPTGTYNKVGEVEAFLNKLPNHVLPVFDEAYFEYACVNKDYPSTIERYFRRRPIVVLRTFSKAYGLAGLRVGYGIAPAACVAVMDKIRPPFNVSIPAQVAAEAAMGDIQFIKKTVSLNESQRPRLAREIEKIGFPVLPSAANFILFNVEPFTGRAVFEKLLKRGIIARSVDEYGLPNYLRVSVGTAPQNQKFLKALREVTKEK